MFLKKDYKERMRKTDFGKCINKYLDNGEKKGEKNN
jgi:hypothetical protein